MNTGEIIRLLRTGQRMSQDQLAKKAGYKTRSSIAKIETGNSDPTQKALVKLAKALNVKPAALVPDKDGDELIPHSYELLVSLALHVPQDKIHMAEGILKSIVEDETGLS